MGRLSRIGRLLWRGGAISDGSIGVVERHKDVLPSSIYFNIFYRLLILFEKFRKQQYIKLVCFFEVNYLLSFWEIMLIAFEARCPTLSRLFGLPHHLDRFFGELRETVSWKSFFL